jgi:hypothetical protein
MKPPLRNPLVSEHEQEFRRASKGTTQKTPVAEQFYWTNAQNDSIVCFATPFQGEGGRWLILIVPMSYGARFMALSQ